MHPDFTTPAGKLGWRVTVSESPKKGEVITLYDKTDTEPIVAEKPLTTPCASAGLSVTVGMSTEFARQKVEVGVWCTIPCATDDVSIAAAYERAAVIAMTEADTRLTNAIAKFFPSLAGD